MSNSFEIHKHRTIENIKPTLTTTLKAQRRKRICK